MKIRSSIELNLTRSMIDSMNIGKYFADKISRYVINELTKSYNRFRTDLKVKIRIIDYHESRDYFSYLAAQNVRRIKYYKKHSVMVTIVDDKDRSIFVDIYTPNDKRIGNKISLLNEASIVRSEHLSTMILTLFVLLIVNAGGIAVLYALYTYCCK